MAPARKFIKDLLNGMVIDQVFLIREKELRSSKSGDQFITVMLCDRSGRITARMWQASASIFNSITVEGFLQVKGRVEDYRGTLQVIIEACRPISAEKVELDDYLPVSEHDVEEMWAELLEILRQVKDKFVRLLIKKFVEDHEFVAAFKRSPAAMQMHHSFIGGLLEHTLGIARAAKALLPLYRKVNADLLLAGVFLHDAGKVAELSSGTSMSYTDRGSLVGHITIAAIWVHQRAAAISAEIGEEFPARTLDCLEHIILSHHGEYEYGAAKLPMIPEAFMLHYLDNLDAKMFMTFNAIENDPDAASSFTTYLKQLDTRIYKKSGQL